jgi:hypothetical protein
MKSKKSKKPSATKSRSSAKKPKKNEVSENETVIYFRLMHVEKENLQAKADAKGLSVNMLLRKFAQK